MRFAISRTIVQLAPALILAASTIGCQSSTAPAPTGVDAFATAQRDKASLQVTSTGAPSASQTFQGGYTVGLTLESVSLYRAANGTFGGDIALNAAISVPGQPALTGALKFTLSCLVFEQRGSAVHVFAQGMAVGVPGAPPGLAQPAYAYLVDDPAGDQMWSGPLGKLGACEVPALITNPDGSMGPVSLKPVQNGTITVTIK